MTREQMIDEAVRKFRLSGDESFLWERPAWERPGYWYGGKNYMAYADYWSWFEPIRAEFRRIADREAA